MSSPSKDLKETESALRSVIQALIDSQEGFKKIGEELQDEKLKKYFLAESLGRAQFRGVLESILHHEGVHDVKESGTAVGTIRRAWADFKSALGGGDTLHSVCSISGTPFLRPPKNLNPTEPCDGAGDCPNDFAAQKQI